MKERLNAEVKATVRGRIERSFPDFPLKILAGITEFRLNFVELNISSKFIDVAYADENGREVVRVFKDPSFGETYEVSKLAQNLARVENFEAIVKPHGWMVCPREPH